jgi:hypothetical protein
MFVGGIAVTYWGIPRTTLDIDLVIALESESIARLATALKTLQFDVRVDDLELNPTLTDLGAHPFATRGAS